MFEVFFTTFQQMMMFFTLMLAGFVLAKSKILPKNSQAVLSKLETFIFVPALTFSTFSRNCTVENLKNNSLSFLFGIGFLLIAIGVAVVLARVFIPKPDYQRNIFRYSFIISNYGYLGNALVLEMFGEEALFRYMMFTQPFSIFIYIFGVAMLDPRSGAKGFRWKSLVNPMLISLVLGITVGLLPFDFPGDLPRFLNFLPKALDGAKACMSPVAMVLTGFVVGSFPLRELLGNWKIYAASALRLMALPALFVLILKGLLTFLPMDGADAAVLTRSLLICTCMPMGLNTIVFPASFGADTRPGAGMAMISTLMGLFTIPLMFMIFGIQV